MTLDQVTVDESSMASVEPLWNALLALKFSEVFAEQDSLFNLETILFQVDHPAVAAVSGRGLINRDRRGSRFGLPIEPGWRQRQQRHEKHSQSQRTCSRHMHLHAG